MGLAVAAVVARAVESRRHRRHAVTSGFHSEISLPGKDRPPEADREAILDQSHLLIEAGRDRIIEAKAASEGSRCCLEGRCEGNPNSENS